MSEEKKFCNFCRLYDMRTKALESDDIEFVKKTLIEFSDLWLNVDFFNGIFYPLLKYLQFFQTLLPLLLVA